MAQQHGNSGRGPKDLDQAERNRAFGGDSEETVDIDDRDEGNHRIAGPNNAAGPSGTPESSDDDDASDEWGSQITSAGAKEDGSVSDDLGYAAGPEAEEDTEDTIEAYQNAINADDEPAGGLRTQRRGNDRDDLGLEAGAGGQSVDDDEELDDGESVGDGAPDERGPLDPESRWGSNRQREE